MLQGCPPPVVTIIFNNTGTDLIVQLKKRQIEWDVNSAIRIANEKNAINWEELILEGDPNSYTFPTLTVRQETRVLKYKFDFRGRGLPAEYVDRSSGEQIGKWQIESDENMYITLPQFPQSMYPVKMLIPQPPGFPLKPEISDSGGIK